ncbi:MAG TPA: hypothetical protein VFW87_14855 [Pirellulales bacterium]|nr:hypothetical protein [Pirellulales bacterium]
MSRRRRLLSLALGAPLALLAIGGCAKLPKQAGSLFGPEAADAVALDVFFVGYPFGDETINGPLFSEIDQQEIPLDVRERLAANGFIAGVLGGQLPPIVGELLHLADLPPAEHPPTVDLVNPPHVRRQLLKTFRVDDPASLITSGGKEPHALLTLLYRDEGQPPAVRGWSLRNAKTILSTKIEPQDDGRVRLELMPAVEHGEARREIVPSEGGLTIKMAPPRKTFDQLRLAAALSPGQMMVIGCRADRPGSLGDQFFTQRYSDRLEQIVLLIRLAQARPAELFAEPTPSIEE